MATVREGEVHYVEHVTSDVETTRVLLEALHGWRFGPPDPALGGSRVAILPNGARCGIRASMHEMEKPLTRSYVRVPSVKRAATKAAKKGALVALDFMKLGEHGAIAIFILNGVEHGVWELPRAKKTVAGTAKKRVARTVKKAAAGTKKGKKR